MKFLGQGVQTLEPKQIDGNADARNRNITTPHS